jgi:predicted nucleic acid-binding protein
LTRIYVDSSAALNMVDEIDSGHATLPDAHYLTSELTLVEVSRALRRMGDEGDVWQKAKALLAPFDLLPLHSYVLIAASLVPIQYLRSLDALHVASAMLTHANVVLTNDKQMKRACEAVGLWVQ